MRSKILNIFQEKKGFSTLVRPKDAIEVREPNVATNLHSKPTNKPQEQTTKFVIRKNKSGEFVLAKFVNGIETDSMEFPNIKVLKAILHQDIFKDAQIDYRIGNDEEEFLKGTEEPQKPREEPLDINFGSSRLLNNRDSETTSYVPPLIRKSAKEYTIDSVKSKLYNLKAIVKDIKDLKSSNVVNSIANDYMNGDVFGKDETTNITRYVLYLIFDSLVDYLTINPETKLIKTQSDIRRYGGNISPVIKELAKELIPTFERYLNRKEKSELFNAFQIVK
jgi:hypothetical protein